MRKVHLVGGRAGGCTINQLYHARDVHVLITPEITEWEPPAPDEVEETASYDCENYTVETLYLDSGREQIHLGVLEGHTVREALEQLITCYKDHYA